MSEPQAQLVPWRGGFMIDPRNVPEPRPGVYRIWHLDSGRSYVGASVDIADRLCAHIYGPSSSPKLQADIGEYGSTSFVVEPLYYDVTSECDLVQAEAALIAEFDSVASGYNTRRSGTAPKPRQVTMGLRKFYLKVAPEQAKRIDEFRWVSRQPSPSAAMRKIVELGLEVAERQAEKTTA
jgi:group I intron endonuclease